MAYNIGANDYSPLRYCRSGGSPVSGHSTNKLLALTLFPLLSALLLLPSAVLAQDIVGEGSRRAESVTGPYTVVADVQMLPSLQSAQFFIRVGDTATGAPAGDVTVTILTTWSGGDETGENIALSPNIPGLYTATLTFEPGRWETTLLIEPPGGGSYGADGFVFEIPEPSGNLEAGFVFLGVSVVLLAGAGYLVWRIRQAQKARNAGSGEAAT